MMRASWTGVLIISVLVALGIQSRASIPPADPHAKSEANVQDFILHPSGLADDAAASVSSADNVEKDFEILRETGAGIFRFGISWNAVAKSSVQNDWSRLDRIVALARRQHVTLIPYVIYTPHWAAKNPSDHDYWRKAPRDLGAFGEFVAALAERYPEITSWELWNKPDNRAYWMGTAAEFAQMVVNAAQKIRAVRPGDKVVLGGLAYGDSPFFDDLMNQFHLGLYVDVIDVHGDAQAGALGQPDDSIEKFRDLASLVREAGRHQDLWMAEQNASPHQAQELFKDQVSALASGFVKLTAWNGIRGSGGIVDAAGRKKPSFYALKFFNRLFKIPVRNADDDVEVSGPPGSKGVVHVFQRQDGEWILVGWLRGSNLSEVRDKTGLATDQRRETVSVKFRPRASVANLRLFDVSGEPSKDFPTVRGNVVSRITLRGDRVFISTLKLKRSPLSALN